MQELIRLEEQGCPAPRAVEVGIAPADTRMNVAPALLSSAPPCADTMNAFHSQSMGHPFFVYQGGGVLI